MTTDTLTLTDFLLARITEDETVATATLTDPVATWSQQYWIELDDHARAHLDRHDPHRVLAECEAKRRILTRCAEAIEAGSAEDGQVMTSGGNLALDTLGLLAAVYADHPAYRIEWA